jgi:RHS repeat-associated protein
MNKQLRYFQLLLPLVACMLFCATANAQLFNAGHKVGSITGADHFNYNQVPDQLVEIIPAAYPNVGISYQWEQSNYYSFAFMPISGATQSSYTFTAPVTQNTYYRRKSSSTGNPGNFIYSNIIKITLVSANWEDKNYLRGHDVQVTGVSNNWTTIDQLAIGDKLESTTYLDGLGRSVQQVSRETATPATTNGLWGDMVQYSQYDLYGREPVRYMPYTTTTQSGKYKTNTVTEQPQYYTTTYNETSAFASITFDNSPLNRVMNVKQPGAAWAASAGRSAVYDINGAGDNVPIFSCDYVQGSIPVYRGIYSPATLYKLSYSDENGKQVIEYIDKKGQQVLKKVQLDDVPAGEYDGWICTVSVYDAFGLMRYQIQPEGVKYLAANNWSFAGVNGTAILNEQCFLYNYDEKGRTIWKKAPGAEPLQMLYDIRDRVVFMQDGNQNQITPTKQWTANLYDELDRPVLSTLYNTNKTIVQLQTDINNAVSNSPITITNPAQPIAALTLNQRQAGILNYNATTTIELVSDGTNNFESLAGDEFTAEINTSTAGGPITVNTTVLNNPISSTDLNNAAVCTILKYLFYDDYSYATAKPFDNSFTNTTAYSNSDPNVQPIAKTERTSSMPTGSMTRVLNSNLFLTATHYYDERGAHIQSIEDNIKGGMDITTLQYHFDGRVLSSCNDHTTPGTDYNRYKTLTKYLFDKLGRATSIQKQFGTNAFKTIAEYAYDDAGRLKKKTLDPGYTNNNGNNYLEELNYSFNIHSQLTGINKDYAQKNPNNYNKWGHYFGMYLGYENTDGVFNAANLTGQVTGQLWNTMGDDAQRKYDYSYDNAGRLTNAAFKEKQHTTDAWASTTMDFSITGTAGKITYDLNGNLLNMLHKGVLPGTAAPITVDNLSYTYASFSNKLQTVTDNMTSTTVNGQFGDFKDGTNGAAPDYVYDNNGNVVIDLNKNAKDLGNVAGNGIKYNYLDKPEQIRIAGKGTITVVYSASGEKLQRSFASETDNTIKTTTYINQFIYEETSTNTGTPISSITPTAINFEEGRIRIITPTAQGNGLDALIVDGNMDLPGGKRGAYDYYIMDYQQNVRMILTEETHTASNTATMETNRAVLEESIFGQTGTSNEVATTRFDTPPGWSGNTTTKVSRTGTLSGHNIGPNTLQKVMAGDMINATVQYYHQGAAGGNSTTMVNNVLTSLVQAITGSGGTGAVIKNNAANISTQLNGAGGFINAVQPNGSNPAGNVPQAFLTAIFFDERFNMVPAADGGVVQQQVAASVGSNGGTLTINPTNYKAPKNGYVYIYLSNQSNNDVYWDNFAAGITQGNIAEENHYYAYGLKVATLSSKKLGDNYEGSLKNNYLYQGAFAELDDDIGWTDFALRNYDAQIGRWVQMDPFDQFASPYVGMGGDPVNLIDPSGGVVIPPIGKTLETVVVTAVRSSSKVFSAANTLSKLVKAVNFSVKVFKVASIINSAVTTGQVGDRMAIYMRGFNNAYLNAMGLGLHDAIWGTNLSDYDDPYDQEAYLKGRIAGDNLVILQGAAEIHGGISGGASAILVSGGTSAIAGAAVVGHGFLAGSVAASDIGWATKKLLRLNVSSTAAGDAGSSSNKTFEGRKQGPEPPEPPKYSKEPPAKTTKLKNGQGYRESNGNIWKKDMKHKDHWDVSDSKGNKIKEVDFNGNQIWPNGSKNKNK